MEQKKTIGIIGGISPMSTEVYYSRIAMEFNAVAGGLNFPRLVLSSVNMADVNPMGKNSSNYNTLKVLITALTDIPSADFILIASNTMHRVVESLKNLVNRDIIDIRESVSEAVLQNGFKKVLLLGSQYTMNEPFFRHYLSKKGIEVVLPCESDKKILNSLIYDKLCRGEVDNESDSLVQDIVEKSASDTNAEAVILACTEFSLLRQEFCIPAFDSSELHVKAAVKKAIFG